jgi:hypothetical protein
MWPIRNRHPRFTWAGSGDWHRRLEGRQRAGIRPNRLCVELTTPQGLLASLENQPNTGMAFLINPAGELPMRLLKFESGIDGALLKQYAGTCPH